MTTALALRDDAVLTACRESIAHHSRSFALASRLLAPAARDHAAVLYAWCRHADDAVDLAPAGTAAQALAGLEADLDAIYGGRATTLTDRGMAAVVAARRIPRLYPAELVAGMAMDVAGTRYRTVDELFVYCHRVAGVVGLMMSHVLGVRDDAALVRAAHLGIAMQLVNVCRDVAEDWQRERLYLPDELLARHGAGGLADELGRPLPDRAAPAIRATVRDLLALARRYDRSGRGGLVALPWRAGFAVRAAGRIYGAIGTGLARRGHDPLAGRVVVSTARKLGHVAAATALAAAEAPTRAWRRLRLGPPRVPTRVVELADVPRL